MICILHNHYFPEIYISILTTIIQISTCDLFLNNNILINTKYNIPSSIF